MCSLYPLHRAIYDLYAGKSYQAEQKLYDKYVESFGDYITSTVVNITH